MHDARRNDGFTLTEVLVAVAIMGVVTAHVFFVLQTQQTAYVSQERILEAQQDGRLVTEFMQADIRTAGFMVPSLAGIASVDGGTSNPDLLCVSDPGVLAQASVDASNSRFDRATLTTLVSAAATSATLLASSMDIDGNGANDFSVGAGIILSDGNDNHCAEVTGIAGSVVSFTPQTPAGFTVGPPGGRAVPALIYEVTAAGLTRNGVLLSSQVENVQVEFGVDADFDNLLGAGEFPIHNLNGSDPAQVQRVRLSVITRTSVEDPTMDGSGMPAAANHTGSAADGFLRRRYTADIFPRNI